VEDITTLCVILKGFALHGAYDDFFKSSCIHRVLEMNLLAFVHQVFVYKKDLSKLVYVDGL
jgi:hypothetical protein